MIAFTGSLSTRSREPARGWLTHLLRRIVRPGRSEDGQALVEMALVLPVLLVLLFGIIDFGHAVNDWNTENSLANLGARYAAVGVISDKNSNCASSAGVLVAYLQCQATGDDPELKNPNGVSPGQPGVVGGISVCVHAPDGDTVGEPITVKVSTPYDVLPFIGGGPTLNLSGTATMRVEQAASAGGLDITTGSTGTC